MAKELTVMQKLFLEHLFETTGGDEVEAKRLAGYSDNYPTSAVVESVKDEIVERTKLFLARKGPKAAFKLVDVLDNPEKLGTKEILTAAKDILDRAGVVKVEKLDVTSNGIFILPAKGVETDDDE